MSPWNIAEGIVLAWFVIKLIGPAGEAEVESYRRWSKKWPILNAVLIVLGLVGWNLYRTWK